MVQFCTQAMYDQELQISLYFFWGGKPLVVKIKHEGFSGELVMSTLDYKLLGTINTSAGNRQ